MTSRHIAYVATPNQVATLIYGSDPDYIRVFPDIVSAAAHAASISGAFVHEATITLPENGEFIAGNQHSPSRFATYYDAFARSPVRPMSKALSSSKTPSLTRPTSATI